MDFLMPWTFLPFLLQAQPNGAVWTLLSSSPNQPMRTTLCKEKMILIVRMLLYHLEPLNTTIQISYRTSSQKGLQAAVPPHRLVAHFARQQHGPFVQHVCAGRRAVRLARWAFQVQLAPNSGVEFAPGEFAAESEALRDRTLDGRPLPGGHLKGWRKGPGCDCGRRVQEEAIWPELATELEL